MSTGNYFIKKYPRWTGGSRMISPCMVDDYCYRPGVTKLQHAIQFHSTREHDLNMAETWTLNTQQANKLLATEMDYWRRSARKSRKEKVRNVEIMEVGKNILEVTEEKRLRWFGHVKRMPGNRLPQKTLEWEPEGTRRRGRPKERWIDGVRRSVTNLGLTEEDTRDRDRWRNLVLGEGKPL
jgi:hypothetical protein